ncbi:PhzA/PhzB family protein [Chroococcidiopsis sp. FACHB-1243]|uniref:nuclear transport factor 2 family protein n=1 Tax=Chroococcidiopsis sp. [FACHB-1243] TaxID=2692781 RepID=UPI00178295EB|nr:nuclear transport factor 2 family protein [Chroococcidiopsis sp. [FACHB-1243]]MBD2309867.1 PhzA/PhzB family protein [Chroococcidiopsis sp. [FACHB-1243]]
MEQNSIAQVFAAHLALIGTDMRAWSDLLAEDAVVEFPYASALGSPSRLEGKPAIYNHMKNAVAQLQNWVFTDVREYQTLLPNVLFAEFHGEAVFVATGQLYQQDYVVRLETKNGKIIHYREYWNPVPILEIVGSSGTAFPLNPNS